MSSDRLKELNTLLATLDAPKEGDEIYFTLEGDSTKYRGVITKKIPNDGVAYYQISSYTQPAPKGNVVTIEYKGKIFKSGI